MTKIEWTDATWNPTRGCSRVSPGCGGPGPHGGCYAERQAIRQSGPGGAYEGLVKSTKAGPRWTGVVRLVPEALDIPLRWKRPRKVFVNSMSDLFHESLSNLEINRVFAAMFRAPQHTFQVLTKRAARMLDYFEWARVAAYLVNANRPEGGPDTWHRGEVLVECDGHNFHERTKEQASHDRRKDRTLQAAGFQVYRYTGADVWRAAVSSAAEVAQACLARAKSSSPIAIERQPER